MYGSHHPTPVIERDPTINRMRIDAFAAMEEILKKECPSPLQNISHEIRFVSYEEALKELVSISQNQFV